MIMADSFCQNNKARSSEFSTTISDTPLIAQFASNNTNDFLDATKLLYPYVDGVDLNCGCPQKWAMKDGYGCALLNDPEAIHSLVRAVKNNIPNSFSVSVKIRILKDLKKTIDLCKQLEYCGVNFLTIHGRTPIQKNGDNVNMDALREVCESVNVPVIANGGVKTLEDAEILFETVQCRGVMAASGILTNPALFSGVNKTPYSCIKLWMNMKSNHNDKITFQCYHHHLVFMLEKILTKQEKQIFNHLSSFECVDNFLKENILNIDYCEQQHFKYNIGQFVNCEFANEITSKHSSKCRGCGKSVYYCLCNKYNYNLNDGQFFRSHVNNSAVLDFTDCNIFDEPT